MQGERYRLGGYTEWRPPRDLAVAVEAVWTYARPRPSPAGRSPGEAPLHLVLPHNGPSLGFRSLRDGRGRVRGGELLLLGPAERPNPFAPPAGLHLEALRVRPEWALPILGVRPDELMDRVVEAPMTPEHARLLDSLLRTATPSGAIDRLLAVARNRLARHVATSTAVLARTALPRLRHRLGPTLDLAALARDLGASERHLRRSIRESTGLSPKRIQRVDRLDGAVMAADAWARPPWARIAYAHGFTDQAHLANEVRAWTGRTPSALHAERRLQRAGTTRR